jgi:hypothetical protein
MRLEEITITVFLHMGGHVFLNKHVMLINTVSLFINLCPI